MNPQTPGSIRKFLKTETRACLDQLEVFPEIESTNSYLLGEPCPAQGRLRIALAEHQTAGRGRHNRVWESPPSTGLCLSTAFKFKTMPRDFPSLSLAVGCLLAQALERIGARGIGLKWPNDIVANRRKLGGILSEVHHSRDAGVTVVTGIGLNIDLQSGRRAGEIATSLGPAMDLASCCDAVPPRAEIAALVIDCLRDTMQRFEAAGFAQFIELWRRYDWLRGQAVTVETNSTRSRGIAQGIDADGALLLDAGGNMRRIISGSVILQKRSGARP